MAMAHVYDWAKGRGYWMGYAADPADKPTHLLLDGGKMKIPDEVHGAFLNAYASSVVRFPERRPCVVELRTRVFKFFVDLDTRFDTAEAAAAAQRLDTVPQPPMLDVLRRACERVADVCGAGYEAMVCSANEIGDGHKMGFHIVWPTMLVTSRTARRVRDAIVDALNDDFPPEIVGVAGTWESIVDATVYKANGLRMPWSGKGRAGDRYYELRGRFVDDAFDPTVVSGVSALRDAVHALSIRTFNKDPTVTLDDDAESDTESADKAWTCRSLSAYSDVLGKVTAALPVHYVGHKFTGLMASEHCVLLRSTARYCFNLGRAHRTNNVYFMLTRRGVCQRCYCRCETAEGRKYGMCKDFSSEVWPVPDEVVSAFFGEEPPAAAAGGGGTPASGGAVRAMPSRAGKSHLSFDRLLARSRPPAAKRAKK